MRIVEIQIQPALRVAGETEDGGGGGKIREKS